MLWGWICGTSGPGLADSRCCRVGAASRTCRGSAGSRRTSPLPLRIVRHPPLARDTRSSRTRPNEQDRGRGAQAGPPPARTRLVAQRAGELLLRVPQQAELVIRLAQPRLPPPVLVSAGLRRAKQSKGGFDSQLRPGSRSAQSITAAGSSRI
jgi:hypothetical protein